VVSGISRSTVPGRDWLLLVALTVMWGSAFALTKAAVDAVDPSQVVLGRLAVGALVLLVAWAIARRAQWPRGTRLWVFFVLIALIGNVVPFSLISWGQQHIDSGLAGLLMAVMPLFTLVLAHFTVPGERLSPTRVMGFAVGLTGVAILLVPDIRGLDQTGSRFALATLAVLLAALCYAVSAILSRLRPPSDVVSSATATTVIGATMMLFVVRPAPQPELVVAAPGALVAIVLLGVFSTALAAVVYFRLIERAGPAFVSQLNYLIPVWAVVLGAALFGERPTTSDYLAMAVILAGIALSQRRSPGQARVRQRPDGLEVSCVKGRAG
jgi:drug/metabolite transporter (DMT)-like permease